MKRIISKALKMTVITVITLSLSLSLSTTGIFAQNYSGTSVPPASSVTPSPPTSTFPPTDGTLSGSSILTAPPYSSRSYDAESEDRAVLYAGGTEGGGNPQKMPVDKGYLILILLAVGYGIVRKRELKN
jgi:hypothetical protein